MWSQESDRGEQLSMHTCAWFSDIAVFQHASGNLRIVYPPSYCFVFISWWQ